jgi:hypothetical protein
VIGGAIFGGFVSIFDKSSCCCFKANKCCQY